MEYVEVYVLAASRTAQLARTFLDAFLPGRRPSAVDFPFPQYSDSPTRMYLTPEELIERLEIDRGETYSLYWNRDGVRSDDVAMLFFTSDAGMIVGLVVPEPAAAKTFSGVAHVVGGQFGYLSGESPPPDTQEEFVRMCRDSSFTRLIDGEVQHR